MASHVKSIMKKVAITVVLLLVIVVAVVMGGSCYMLDYALAPDSDRKDTAHCFRKLFDRYPEMKPWVDSLQRIHALRDTFITMPTRSNERHHAYYIDNGSNKTAVVLHGWRNCAIDMLFLARIYDRELGYNVVAPDLHAHGLSDGDAVGMGWLDRKDILYWMQVFQTDTMVVHGISMGSAATMMVAGEDVLPGISDIRFVADCGYTSAWDEFAGQLKEQFGLPSFPLMYTTSMLCQLRYGWNFREASSLQQVRKAKAPMLFIHGAADTFVPTAMVHELYDAKPEPKKLWIAIGAIHAFSYKEHKSEYIERVKSFVSCPN